MKKGNNIIYNFPTHSSITISYQGYLKPINQTVPEPILIKNILIKKVKYVNNGFNFSSKNRARYQDFSRSRFKGSFRTIS